MKISKRADNNKKHIEKAILHIQKAIEELKKINSHYQDYSYFIKCLEDILSSDHGEAGLSNYLKR